MDWRSIKGLLAGFFKRSYGDSFYYTPEISEPIKEIPEARALPKIVTKVKSNLNPVFKGKLDQLMNLAREAGLNVGIHQDYRSFQAQDTLYSLGRTKGGKKVTNAKGGQSWHNYGLAADVVFKDSKGRWSWAEENPWGVLGKLGQSVGLEWGGAWNSALKDRPHFQLTCGMNIKEAQILFKKGGIVSVWERIK